MVRGDGCRMRCRDRGGWSVRLLQQEGGEGERIEQAFGYCVGVDDPGSVTASAGSGTAKVTIDGAPQDVDGQVVCSTVGDNFNIAIGNPTTGIGVMMAEDGSKVNSVGLGNVNGVALGFKRCAGRRGVGNQGRKDLHDQGTATGVDMANPMQPMTKPFEISVTCPSGKLVLHCSQAAVLHWGRRFLRGAFLQEPSLEPSSLEPSSLGALLALPALFTGAPLRARGRSASPRDGQQPLQARHTAPAPDQAEIEVVGIVGQRDVHRLAVQGDRQRIIAVQPRAIPVQGFPRSRHVEITKLNGGAAEPRAGATMLSSSGETLKADNANCCNFGSWLNNCLLLRMDALTASSRLAGSGRWVARSASNAPTWLPPLESSSRKLTGTIAIRGRSGSAFCSSR